MGFKPLNAELNPICHLLALLGAHHILNISRIRVNCINALLCTVWILHSLLVNKGPNTEVVFVNPHFLT